MKLVEEKKPASPVVLPVSGLVPFFTFFSWVQKPWTLDPSQNKEEGRPRNLNASKSRQENTSPKDLKEALDLASARKRIRADANSSGQECGEALDSALTKN